MNLFDAIIDIPNINKENVLLIESAIGGNRIIDLLLHKPFDYDIRKKGSTIANIKDKDTVIIPLKILFVKESKLSVNGKNKRKLPTSIMCVTDDGIDVELMFFIIASSFLSKFVPNKHIVCNGKIEIKKSGCFKMIHPKIIASEQNIQTIKIIQRSGGIVEGDAPLSARGVEVRDLKKFDDFGDEIEKFDGEIEQNIEQIIPVYSLSGGISQIQMKNIIQYVLKIVIFPYIFEERKELFELKKAIFKLHNPEKLSDIKENAEYFEILAKNEILASQLMLAYMRKDINEENGLSIVSNGYLLEKLLKNLPFQLTNSQISAIQEIENDQKSKKKMIRLLQGDVGSGKTIVALICALKTVESGLQVAIMAPTAILAKQHYDSMTKFCFGLGITIDIITGSTSEKERKEIVLKLKLGMINIIIGTHALFYDKIKLNNFGLFIIDEQHNFGVEQRLSLIKKSERADVLMMSATPIPRTLIMSMYGDISISILTEKPKDRQKIETNILSISKYDHLVKSIKNKILNENAKIYWVCPLVEESEKMDLMDANSRFEDLKKIILANDIIADNTSNIEGGAISFIAKDEIIGMIHGKMKQDKKDEIMMKFKNGKYKLLVATTVIEVGVDIPDATIIIIEHAERFGLAQLHQLRGRVGRGNLKSHCILFHVDNISYNAKKRLTVLKNYDDGFIIAEHDLKFRGGGELLGTKQSGFKQFKFATYSRDKETIMYSTAEAKKIIQSDPNLTSKDNEHYRLLIKIFYTNGFEKDNI